MSRFMQGPWECPPSLEGCPKGQDGAMGDGRHEPPGPPAACQEAARNSAPSSASGSLPAPSTAGSRGAPCAGPSGLHPIGAPLHILNRGELPVARPPAPGSSQNPHPIGARREPHPFAAPRGLPPAVATPRSVSGEP